MHSSKEFRDYLDNISKHPRLGPGEERRLASLAQKGNHSAFDELVLANMRLVVSIARRYLRNCGIPMEDLVSHGSVGLIKSIEHFDGKRGDTLGPYARYWIEKEIIIAISEQGHPLRIPVQQGARIAKMQKTARYMRCRLNREPDTQELEKALGVSRETMDNIRWMTAPQISLHESTSNGYTLEEALHESETISLEDAIIEKDRNTKLETALSKLTRREQRLIRMSNGFGLPERMTLQEIAKKLKIARDRASDIQEVAMCKLRMEIQRQGLENARG